MITESTIYWITRLDSIGCFICAVGTLCAITGAVGVIIGLVGYLVCNQEYEQTTKAASLAAVKVLAWPLIGGLTLLFIGVFVPNTKEALMIYGIPALVNSKAGQEAAVIPEKVVKIMNQYLDGKIKETAK